MEDNYTKIERKLPLIPLRGLAIFPYMILNFDIGRDISLKALDEAMLADELVFLTSQKDVEVDEPTEEDFYHVGTVCKVKQMLKLPGDTVRVLVEGISRGKIKEVNQDSGFFEAVIDEIIYDESQNENNVEVKALVRNILEAFEEYINIGNRVWLGLGSSILKGTTIAEGCVVGAFAVVAKSFKTPNSLIVGSPAIEKANNITRLID